MENYGITLKMIRKSLELTQAEISAGIMSQSNYSKVEKGEIEIPFSKMINLLDRLGMSVDEFLYVHRDYTKNPGNQLKRLTQLKAGDKESILKHINELKLIENPTPRDQQMIAIFEALLLVSNNDYKAAQIKVLHLWKRLEKHNQWYIYDLRLINAILYLFPIDIAKSIVNLAFKRINDYNNFRSMNQMVANLQINYLLLLIDNKKYSMALNEVESLISFFVDKRLYIHLGTCYVRKGILLKILSQANATDWYNKGFDILNKVNNGTLVQELKNEIEHYTTVK